MNRWLLVLMLWSAQAFAKPQMKGEPVEAKSLTPSSICQTGPFEVSFTAIEAKHGQQIRLDLESIATGASLKYEVSVGGLAQRDGNYTTSSLSNTIDPCAPASQAPAPQTNSVTVAPKAQTVGPITVLPAPVTVTVVTPPQNAPFMHDRLVVALPASLKAGEQVTLTIWAQKPIVAKSMLFSLEQIVPIDPVAYAEWEAKQAAKAEAQAERAAKREARREERQEARAIKVAIKSQEKEKKLAAKAVTVSAQAAVSFEVKTQKAAEKEVKLSARMERRQSRKERRELKLSIKEEKRAPKREAKLAKQRENAIEVAIRVEKKNRQRMAKRERRELKLSIRREKRAPIKMARVERHNRHDEARFKVRTEKRHRRDIQMEHRRVHHQFKIKERHTHREFKSRERRIAREPKLVLRSKKDWARYEAKDKKLVAKIGELQANEKWKQDRLEARRYNLFMSNLHRVEGVYESLLTVELKAQFKVELYDEVLALQPAKEAAYNLYVDTRNQEEAQLNAAAALETNTQKTETVALVEAPKRPEAPAPLTEVVGPAPTPDASWQAGYWQWSGNRYIWIEGRWVFAQVQLPPVKIVVQKEKKPAPKNPGYSATKPK
jgi:hypothetical protein